MIASAPMMIVTSPIVAEKDDDGMDGSTWFEVSGSHGHQYETLVIRLHLRLSRIADERIWTDGNATEKGYYINDGVDREDGDEGEACHNINLSPDKKWLFVDRSFYHGMNAAYLFHFTGKGFVRVHPQGWRFDEAALRYFGGKLHFVVPGLTAPDDEFGGQRGVYFDHWTPNSKGVVFNFYVCGFVHRGINQRFIQGTAYYDVHSRRFQGVKVEDERWSSLWPPLALGDSDGGSSGAAITMTQYLLCARGLPVTVDGRYGVQTQQRVRQFQKSRGLKITGVVDGPTWKSLIVALHPGQTGFAVKALQASLSQYDRSLPVDGHFGKRTQQSLRAFERLRRLQASETVVPRVWLLLTDDPSDWLR